VLRNGIGASFPINIYGVNAFMSNQIEPNRTATHCMIWMHGLGASYQDMAGLAQELKIMQLPLRHVFLQAPTRPVTINQSMPMPAWYDIKGATLTDREDREGILASEQQIIDEIARQESLGIPTSKIFLAGFSQGGAMALHTALNTEQYLAGVVALSAYLPLVKFFHGRQRKSLPIFMASGSLDQVVKQTWSEQSYQYLESTGYKRILFKSYPMMHEVCLAEIQDLRQWITDRVGQINS
jgi:phospholipase/carboxylesterase